MMMKATNSVVVKNNDVERIVGNARNERSTMTTTTTTMGRNEGESERCKI